MAEFPALPLFTDALLGDTLHLTNGQFGSYMLLLIVEWRTKDCRLPDDDDYLAKIARMDRRAWEKNKGIILAFFKKDKDGFWYQGRLVDERKYVEEQRRKNSKAGIASALKRKGRDSTNVEPEDNENQTPTPTPTPTPIECSKEHSIPDEKIEDTPINRFEDWWKIFPTQRRGSKQKAEDAYRKALKRATEQEIHDGTLRYRESREVREGYAKGAAAWLNDDRWTTDYSQRVGKQSRTEQTAQQLKEWVES